MPRAGRTPPDGRRRGRPRAPWAARGAVSDFEPGVTSHESGPTGRSPGRTALQTQALGGAGIRRGNDHHLIGLTRSHSYESSRRPHRTARRAASVARVRGSELGA